MESTGQKMASVDLKSTHPLTQTIQMSINSLRQLIKKKKKAAKRQVNFQNELNSVNNSLRNAANGLNAKGAISVHILPL